MSMSIFCSNLLHQLQYNHRIFRRGSNESNTWEQAQGLKVLLHMVLRDLPDSKVLP